MSSNTQATSNQYLTTLYSTQGAVSPSTQVTHSQEYTTSTGLMVYDRTKGISNIALEIVHSPELSRKHQMNSYLLFLNGKKVIDVKSKVSNRANDPGLVLKGTVKILFQMANWGGIEIYAKDINGLAQIIIEEPTKCIDGVAYSALVSATPSSTMKDKSQLLGLTKEAENNEPFKFLA